MRAMTIEWAPFTLVEGATEEQLLRASEDLQVEFLARQPGFVSRELLRRSEREWCDLVHWENEAAAHAAMTRVAESPVCLRYFRLMAAADHHDPGAGVQLFAQRAAYAPA